jgi:hypothetical protein
MADAGSMPSPQLLGEYSQLFRSLSEPTGLQRLCQLKQGAMDAAGLIETTGFRPSPLSRLRGQWQHPPLQCLKAQLQPLAAG